jgi:hypothetical protein
MRVSILFTVLVIVTTFQTSYADHEHHYVSDGKSGKGSKNSKYKLFKNDKAGKVTHDATSSSASMSMSMSMSMNSESHEHGKTGKEAKYVIQTSYADHEHHYVSDGKSGKGSKNSKYKLFKNDKAGKVTHDATSSSASMSMSMSMSMNSESHEHGKTGKEAKYVKGHDYDTKAAKGYHHYYGKTSKEAKHAKGSYINYKVHDEDTAEWSYDSH